MAFALIAHKHGSAALDRRGRPRSPRPRSPKLGDFRRVYKAFPEFSSDATNLLGSPFCQAPELEKAPVGPLNHVALDGILLQELAALQSIADDDSPVIITSDDDSPARDSVLSAGVNGTRDTTPATSPSSTIGCEPEMSGKPSTEPVEIFQIARSPYYVTSEPIETFQIARSPCFITPKPIVQHDVYQTPCQNAASKNGPRKWYLPDFQIQERIRVAKLCAKERRSNAAEPVDLPWDMDGNYFLERAAKIPSLPVNRPPVNPWTRQQPGQLSLKPLSQNVIDPFYQVSKDLQLKIMKAKLDPAYADDDALRAHSGVVPQAREPIHIFVDLSNVIIGFYNEMKARRFIRAHQRIQAPPFFFEAFAMVLERGRPCAKRVVAGSVRAGGCQPGYMLEAAQCGYEMNILQRVSGRKKNGRFTNQYESMSGDSSDDSQWPMRHREQGVDEVLHLKMVQSLLDSHRPATLVLATGDAAEAEFSDGFFKNVERALERGWNVEVVGWRENMSSAWYDDAFLRKWDFRFRTIELDSLVEELLGLYRRSTPA